MKCERCKAKSKGDDLFDYCAVCSKNLCPACMAQGHCGNVPAKSGMEADHADSAPPPPKRKRLTLPEQIALGLHKEP